jgi:hypothetical protein
MSDGGKSQLEAGGAGLLGFSLVVVVGAYFVLPHGLAAPKRAADDAISYVPPVTLPDPAPAPVAAVTPAPPISSPAPLLPASPEAPPRVAVAAGPVKAAPPPPPVPVVVPKLNKIAGLGTAGGSSANAATPGAPAPKGAKPAPEGAQVAVGDRRGIEANFGTLGGKGDPMNFVMHQVDAAQAAVNGSSASPEQKAAVNEGVDQFHTVAYQAEAEIQAATVQANAPVAGAAR